MGQTALLDDAANVREIALGRVVVTVRMMVPMPLVVGVTQPHQGTGSGDSHFALPFETQLELVVQPEARQLGAKMIRRHP
jgi:hypothetical protein